MTTTSALKTKRITILVTPGFKDFLTREAKKEGVSLSQLVRDRCEKKPTSSEDEELLSVLLKEVRAATTKARISLEKGLDEAEMALTEIRRSACAHKKMSC